MNKEEEDFVAKRLCHASGFSVKFFKIRGSITNGASALGRSREWFLLFQNDIADSDFQVSGKNGAFYLEEVVAFLTELR